MKSRYALAFALALASTIPGCTQVPPNPTSYTCPAVTAANYTPLGAASASLVQTDAPPPGASCYTAQSENNTFTPSLVSLPQTPPPPVTVASGQKVTITLTAPASGVVPTGYVVSRAPAIAVTILAPPIGQQVAQNAVPLAGEVAGNLFSGLLLSDLLRAPTIKVSR